MPPSHIGNAARSIDASTAYDGRGLVLYDFLLCWGGAEHVSLSLARNLSGSELCVGYRDPRAFAAKDLRDIVCHELGGPPMLNVRGWRTLSGMQMFERRAAFIARYDWAIFSGSNAPVAVAHRPSGGNIYYCHTVPRLAYDLYDWYRDRLPKWQRPALGLLAQIIRRRYEDALAQMDRVVANSDNVQARLSRYLGISAEVVHPPCDTGRFQWIAAGDYYLSTARLERYKRVDVIVEAFRRMPEHQLVVASGGSEEGRLRRLAADADNIRFVGWLSDEALRRWVGCARATIYVAKDEDFGMSPVESMAAGKPVIGVDDGGIRESVVHGESGILVEPEPTPERIMDAARRLSNERAVAMREACERRAAAFSTERFVARMRETVDAVTVGPGQKA